MLIYPRVAPVPKSEAITRFRACWANAVETVIKKIQVASCHYMRIPRFMDSTGGELTLKGTYRGSTKSMRCGTVNTNPGTGRFLAW